MAKKIKSPSEQRTDRYQMRVSPTFIKEIDDWRRQQPDLPSRNEAIFRLTALALEAEANKKNPSTKAQGRGK